jgi:hypothetical protein
VRAVADVRAIHSRRMSEVRAPEVPPRSQRRWLGAAGFALLLALPRVLRIAYPEVWVEDDFYLASAWLVAQGDSPYHDFVHPHLPLLEWAVAGWIGLAGASHRSFEVLTAVAVTATSALVWRIGERAFGRLAGLAGALLFAWSSLGFRYHVFERESIAALALCAGLWLALRERRGPVSGAVAIGLCCFAAAAVKLTTAIPAAGVLAALAWDPAERRRALAAAGVALAALALLVAGCAASYGAEFWQQLVLFHLGKGRHAAVSPVLFPARVLDVIAPLSLLGVALARRGPASAARRALFAWVGSGYAFYALASPTIWAHNLLELLPALAALAGSGAAWIARTLAARGVPDERRARSRIAGVAAIAATALGLAGPTPLVNENWERDSVYGFGFVPRGEIAELAAALRAAEPRDALVAAPAFLCVEAGRRPLLRFPETQGVARDLALRAARDGWWRTWRDTRGADFFERIGGTARHWLEPLYAGLASRSLAAFVPDSPLLLQALVGPPPERLRSLGYRPALRSQHFTLWLPRGSENPGD